MLVQTYELYSTLTIAMTISNFNIDVVKLLIQRERLQLVKYLGEGLTYENLTHCSKVKVQFLKWNN